MMHAHVCMWVELCLLCCLALSKAVCCVIAADPSQMADKSVLLCREDFLRATEFGKCSADCALMWSELCVCVC